MIEIDQELKSYGYTWRYRFGGNLYAIRLGNQEQDDISQEILLGNADSIERMTPEQRKSIYDRKLRRA